jgi:MFS family permease
MILTGVGVGLTLPTMMATATASLPPQSFATGSAVVNTLRQVGLAIGVAMLIAVLGNGGNPTRPFPAFRHGWDAIVIAALAAAVVSAALLRPKPTAVRVITSTTPRLVPDEMS